jgi:hypothetical protein
VLLGVGAWMLRPRSTEITCANAAMVQEGMTRADVESILGGPPRDDSNGPLTLDLSEALESYDRPHWSKWASDQVVIWCQFDADGKVNRVAQVPVRRVQESSLDMLRRWLRL